MGKILTIFLKLFTPNTLGCYGSKYWDGYQWFMDMSWTHGYPFVFFKCMDDLAWILAYLHPNERDLADFNLS